VTALRREARELKEVVAEQTLELQLLKKNHISDPQLVPQCDFFGIVVSKIDGDSFGSYWRRCKDRSPWKVII
jgi:hypothetical protein